jgi:biopolymer transport protein ExbD
MAMRLGSGSSGEDDLAVAHEINVTPFIDVMLVLLIIFMVAAPLATVDVDVDLPVARAEPAPRPETPVYLSIRAGGAMVVNETPVSAGGLGQAIEAATGGDREQRVFLRADKAVPYGASMEAMNGLRASGYLHVGLVGVEAAPGR